MITITKKLSKGYDVWETKCRKWYTTGPWAIRKDIVKRPPALMVDREPDIEGLLARHPKNTLKADLGLRIEDDRSIVCEGQIVTFIREVYSPIFECGRCECDPSDPHSALRFFDTQDEIVALLMPIRKTLRRVVGNEEINREGFKALSKWIDKELAL